MKKFIIFLSLLVSVAQLDAQNYQLWFRIDQVWSSADNDYWSTDDININFDVQNSGWKGEYCFETKMNATATNTVNWYYPANGWTTTNTSFYCGFEGWEDDDGTPCSYNSGTDVYYCSDWSTHSVSNFTTNPRCQWNDLGWGSSLGTNSCGGTFDVRVSYYWDYAPVGNPATFGSNVWNFYAYDGQNRDLTGITYKGYYSKNSLSFNTINDYVSGANGTPSSVSGYQGGCVPEDNHTVVAKRQGFPCGVYSLNVVNHDDEASLYVDDVSVWAANCCSDNGVKWTGYLDASSKVEMRYAEGSGGAGMGLNFAQITTWQSDGSLEATNGYICTGATNGEITVKNSLYHNESFASLPTGFTLYNSATLTGGRIRLTPASNSQSGAAVISNTGHGATSFRTTFDLTNVGADGYCFSYGPNLNAYAAGGLGAVEDVGVGNALTVGFDYYQNVIILRYGGVNIRSVAYPLNSNNNVVFTVDEVGRASLTMNGTAVFTNVFIGKSYFTANKGNWEFAFAGRTGGVNGLHSIDNLFIGEYEYSKDGSTWQTSPIFSGLTVGSYTIDKRLLVDVCNNTLPFIGPEIIYESSTVSAVGVSPTCVNGTDGSIELAVSGVIHGARVVKIVQLDNEALNTNEIQAFQVETGINKALSSLGGGAAMSSEFGAAYPTSWLNDGNTANGIGAHTLTGVGEWQKVYWDEPITLDRIVIWNRTNCCNERLDNLRLEVYGDLAETNLLLSEVIDADNGLATSYTYSTININANPLNTYLWSNSATTEDLSGLSPGNYNVTVTDPYGCVNTVNNIAVANPITHSLGLNIMQETCAGDGDGAIDLTVTNPRTSAAPNAFSGLVLWTKADAGVVKNKEGEVLQWQDLSGNNQDFFTYYGDNVQLVDNTINGEPVVRFDGGNLMKTADFLNSNYTLIVVGKLNAGSNSRLVSSAKRNWLLGWWGGNRDQYFAEGWVYKPSSNTALTTPYIYSATGNLSSDSYQIWRNGQSLQSNSSGSQAPGAISLGGWGLNNSERSTGDIAEIIAFNRVLTDDERKALEKYLSDKYSIAGPTGVDPTFSWAPNGETTEDISNLSSGTYTVTVVDAAGCSTVQSGVVGTAKTESVAMTTASASSTFSCAGENVTLSVGGGSLGTGASWKWYSDAAHTTAVGSGASVVVAPTVTTTYYVRAEGDCNNTTDLSVTVNINGGNTAPSSTVVLAGTTSSSTCVVSDNNWHYFYNSNGALLAAINSNNQDLGAVTITITVGDNGPFGAGFGPGACGSNSANTGELVMPRYWDIDVTNQPSSKVDVIFYYNSADVATLVTTLNSASTDYLTCWGDVNSETDLMMTVEHDNSTELFTSLSPSAGPGSGQRQIAFQLTEFSGGKLHSNGGITGIGNPLPVELISFEANAVQNEFIVLNWATATEINNEGFELQRSENGLDFYPITFIHGNGNSTVIQNYLFEDHEATIGTHYYRLKQVDFDGAFVFSSIKSAQLQKSKEQISLSAFIPNPAENTSRLKFELFETTSAKILVLDNIGRVVEERELILNSGLSEINFDTHNYAEGTYTVEIMFPEERFIRKLMIQK